MKRLKSFIEEAETKSCSTKNCLSEAAKRTTSISNAKTISLLRSECKIYLQYLKSLSPPKQNSRRSLFYRGVSKRRKGNLYVDPSLLFRRAQGLGDEAIVDYHTTLMTHTPFWKNFPPRTRSVIFTNDAEVSLGYAGYDIYAVIPTDVSKFGVCTKPDVYYIFGFSVPRADRLLFSFFDTFLLHNHAWKQIGRDESSINLIKQDCKKIDKILAHYDFDIRKVVATAEKLEPGNSRIMPGNLNIDRVLMSEIDIEDIPGFFSDLKKYKNTYKVVSGIFVPKNKNAIRLIPSVQGLLSHTKSANGNEIWTDSPCILIPSDNTDILDKAINEF
jgi:hypothetical protein